MVRVRPMKTHNVSSSSSSSHRKEWLGHSSLNVEKERKIGNDHKWRRTSDAKRIEVHFMSFLITKVNWKDRRTNKVFCHFVSVFNVDQRTLDLFLLIDSKLRERFAFLIDDWSSVFIFVRIAHTSENKKKKKKKRTGEKEKRTWPYKDRRKRKKRSMFIWIKENRVRTCFLS